VFTARRRLLLMLLVLSIASGALAGTKMAAWWVIVPPSVMLLGYLLLLRTSAKADAERRDMAQSPMARPAAGAVRAPVRRPAPVPRDPGGSDPGGGESHHHPGGPGADRGGDLRPVRRRQTARRG